jgi:serine/threonine protein kinase
MLKSAWRAPETFVYEAEAQEVSTKTDVYMFGGLMIEVLTGRRPWWWLTDNSLNRLRYTSTSNAMTDAKNSGKWELVVKDVSTWQLSELESIIGRCLCVESSERPEMRVLVQEIERLAKSDYGGYVQ